ncbi:hypothetical protein TSAR_014698 [Trichomalopsis sarcophagae]|uniref:Uncharacterized protein n=1 Tax=Trichomalopsis sarcophagae TaxID=543379 RepID=A0A232EHF4_9HYME|nr:hypothetical protein TSAR_014698 [Trichomalopsis sarcophagae]
MAIDNSPLEEILGNATSMILTVDHGRKTRCTAIIGGRDPGFLLGHIGAISASDALSVSTGEPPLTPALTDKVRKPRRTG